MASKSGVHPIVDPLQRQHDQAKAGYEHLVSARDGLDRTREQLAGLVKMGLAVTTDDVVKAAGSLVSSGNTTAHQMATILAGMPTKPGQALTDWVSQQEQTAAANEAKLGPLVDVARHHLGLSALRLAVGHAMQPPSGVPPQEPGNELAASPNLANMPSQGSA